MAAWCPLPDRRPYGGVVGVLSAEGREVYRTMLRHTWLAESATLGLPSRFVVRGVGASDTLLEEARAYGDIVLVYARASLPRAVGPLHSLFGWWRCALTAWPGAELVGKADDDVWVDIRGVLWQLAATRAVLTNKLHAEPSMLWGVIETFHWSPTLLEPYGFSYRFGKTSACAVWKEHGELLSGPFPFAKGPLFFLSSSLVSEVLLSGTFDAELASLTRRFAPDCSGGQAPNCSGVQGKGGKGTLPFEDVYAGYLLSTITLKRSNSSSPLVVVHAGLATLGEPSGYQGALRHTAATLHVSSSSYS